MKNSPNTLKGLAGFVIEKSRKPLTCKEIWEISKKLGLLGNIKAPGKTPWRSMSAEIYVEIRDKPETFFCKVGVRPTKFFLKKLVT